MKKYILFPCLLAFCFLIPSCSKFLSTSPEDFLSPINYYETEEQLQAALNGVYSRLQQDGLYGANLWSYQDIADEFFWSLTNVTQTSPNIAIYKHTTSDSQVKSLWQICYEGIGQANTLLANINKPAMDEKRRDVIQGEALFLRAYYYFLLVSRFGQVPMTLEPITSPTGNNMPASSIREVYDRIILDMETAEKLVLPIQNIGYGGRVSKSAVRGILARVNLYMAGYPLQDKSRLTETVKWTSMLMEDEVHKLNPDYTDIFKRYARDEYDIGESIWEVEFWGNRADAYLSSGRLGSRNGIEMRSNNYLDSIGFAYGQVSALARLYRRYESGDTRRDWAIAPFRFSSSGKHTNWKTNELYERNCGKWRREYEVVKPKNKNYTPQNFPILRYADVLLMHAEAVNELEGPSAALPALNEVRARANASLYEGANAITDKYLLRGEIREERSRELCFEGLRKMDLIRWGIFLDTMYWLGIEIAGEVPASKIYAPYAAQNVSERHLLLPVPSYELTLNRSLVQNPNW